MNFIQLWLLITMNIILFNYTVLCVFNSNSKNVLICENNSINTVLEDHLYANESVKSSRYLTD